MKLNPKQKNAISRCLLRRDLLCPDGVYTAPFLPGAFWSRGMSKISSGLVVGSNTGLALLIRKRWFVSIHNWKFVDERRGLLNPSREKNEGVSRRRVAGAPGRGHFLCELDSIGVAERGWVVLTSSVSHRLWAMQRNRKAIGDRVEN